MFGLFKSSSTGFKVVDKIWMSKQAKLNACAAMLQSNPDCLFIAWFEETARELMQAIGHQENKVIMARDAAAFNRQGRMVILAEHYPLPAVEQTLFAALNMKEIPVLTAMDEPFFAPFNPENMISLMKKMGMKEHEVVSHSMVSKSIRRAQEVISERTETDHPATSQQEWFSLNVNWVHSR